MLILIFRLRRYLPGFSTAKLLFVFFCIVRSESLKSSPHSRGEVNPHIQVDIVRTTQIANIHCGEMVWDCAYLLFIFHILSISLASIIVLWWLLFPSFLLHLLMRISLKEGRLSLLPHLFIQSFICIHGYLYVLFPLDYNPVLLLFILLFKLFSLWWAGSSLSWSLCLFIMFPWFFGCFFIFWHQRVFQAHLSFPLSQP